MAVGFSSEALASFPARAAPIPTRLPGVYDTMEGTVQHRRKDAARQMSTAARNVARSRTAAVTLAVLFCVCAWSQTAAEYYAQGVALYKQGKLEAAAQAFTSATKLDPKLTKAWVGLGAARYAQGKLTAAVSAWRQAIELDPRNANVHSNLGAALTDLGKLPEAIEACRQAIRLKPDFAGAHMNLGRALYKSRKYPQAIASLKTAIRLKPDFADAWLHLGIVYARGTNQPAEAVRCFREYLRLSPKQDDCTCWVIAYIEKHGG